MSEQPYDPYIPSGQTGGASRDGNQRTAALQAVRRPGKYIPTRMISL